MGIVYLIVVGGLLGWLASIVLRSEDRSDILLNVAVGTCGAFLAGLVINPLVGGGDLLGGNYSALALLIALCGSLVTLAIVNFMRRQAIL